MVISGGKSGSPFYTFTPTTNGIYEANIYGVIPTPGRSAKVTNIMFNIAYQEINS